MLPELRAEVCKLHQALPDNNLVAWTSGNISGRDPETGLVVIKPSGLKFADLTPESMVVVDEDGSVVEGLYKPSSDTASHCYIYRHRADIHGVVHTHSRYATAFAVVGKSIPCVTTALADEFGGPIPCCDFALIGNEQIGAEIVKMMAHNNSQAMLLRNHGVFTFGKDAEAAVKAAVMVEDNAAIVWMAMQIGEPLPISDEDVAKLHDRYVNVYGQ
ncbi:MAG: L-ribulose-5-phosphate 4-epimerase [Chloroflexi bacterium]|nr:L-ribulose-5-phosphate 4-epimerase [Chloroflexota bacterium]